MTSRLGTRFPSLSSSRRMRSSSLRLGLSDQSRSRANSASSTIVSPAISVVARQESLLPPSPAQSFFEESARCAPIDIQKANSHVEEEPEGIPNTPLLPPMMSEVPTHIYSSPMQSPLQSPSVADPMESISTTTSILNTPVDTPRQQCLPSPPLSTKPSTSSFHQRAGFIIPSAEIPHISMPDPSDKWSHKLGHANFAIAPEPFVPQVRDVKSFAQLQANWDLARCNYLKHLVRTGEHYGVTSRIYKLTEEKWAEIDAQWKNNHDITAREAGLHEAANTDFPEQRKEPSPAIQIASLNDPNAEGKFPDLGDQDIVGPMSVAQPLNQDVQPQRSPSKKRGFMKFFQDFRLTSNVLLGRSSSTRQRRSYT